MLVINYSLFIINSFCSVQTLIENCEKIVEIAKNEKLKNWKLFSIFHKCQTIKNKYIRKKTSKNCGGSQVLFLRKIIQQKITAQATASTSGKQTEFLCNVALYIEKCSTYFWIMQKTINGSRRLR